MYLTPRKLAEMFKNPDDLVDIWIRCSKKDNSKDDDPDFHAWEYLDVLVRSDPGKALGIMDLIVTKSHDDPDVLASIGAGPLEDLLGHEYGVEYADAVIDRARKFKNWRFALGCVWTTGFKDKKVAAKVEERINEYFPNGRP